MFRIWKLAFFITAVFGMAVVGHSAEWRFRVSSSDGSGSNLEAWMYDLDVMYQAPGDSMARPTSIGVTPGGVEITVSLPEGSDTVFWKFETTGSSSLPLAPSEGVRKACRTCPKDPGIDLMIAENPVPQVPPSDTQQVFIQGNQYAYIRSATPWDRTSVYSSYSDMAYLKGLGIVFFHEGASTMMGGRWSNSFRLLRYNGINIDSLWGNALAAPVNIAASKRPAAVRHLGRKFKLDEMGIFLGRKSALDRSKPLPAVVK